MGILSCTKSLKLEPIQSPLLMLYHAEAVFPSLPLAPNTLATAAEIVVEIVVEIAEVWESRQVKPQCNYTTLFNVPYWLQNGSPKHTILFASTILFDRTILSASFYGIYTLL